MSAIAQALDGLVQHREIVPVYYNRATREWIVAGVAKTNGGAVVIDDADGRIVRAAASKRAALSSISNNN